METWRTLFEQYRTLPRRMAEAYKRKLPPCVDIDDLEQCGLIGLMEAAKRFDSGRHVRFATYAGRRIHGAMVDGIRSMDWATRLSRQRGEKITELMSMESAVAESADGRVTVADMFESHEALPGTDLADAEEFDYLTRGLPARHRRILGWYYADDLSPKEIGHRLGLTPSRFFQILAECKRWIGTRAE